MKRRHLSLLFILVLCVLCSCSSKRADLQESALSNQGILEFSEFSGKKIAIATGSIYELGLKQTTEIVDPEILYFDSVADVLNAVKQGKAFAGAEDYPVSHLAELHGEGIKVSSDFFIDEDCAFILPKGSTLMGELNSVINRFKEDGTIDALMEKWYNADEKTQILSQTWPGSKGVLKVSALSGAEPISYVGDGGSPCGFDIDIILHLARELDYHVDFIWMDYAAMIASISTGKTDLGCGSIAITDERKQAVDFTDVVYSTGAVLFTKSVVQQSKGIIENLKSNFVKTFVTDSRWKLFLSGSLTTLAVSVISIVGGTILGFGFYMLYKTGNKIIVKAATFFQWFIDGIPVVVLLMILYYVIFGSSQISGIWVSTFAFILIMASNVLGMLITGVGAISKGQEEGGLALGYTESQTFFKIILPQAARIFMPGYKNSIVQLIKGTAIVGYIAVQDLTKVSDLVRSRTFAPFFPLIVSAVVYFIMAWLLTIAVDIIIKKISPQEDRAKRADYLKGVQR